MVGGTEEGRVVGWDTRSCDTTWGAVVAGDYVGGVALTPGCGYVVAGAADGWVLDLI